MTAATSDPKVFSLEGKGLKLDTAADIDPHLLALRQAHSIEEVRLLGNTLGVGACEAMARVLETKKTLQVANLSDIFTSRLLSEIPTALSHLLTALLSLPNLHTVDLSDNAFGLNTQAPLVEFLSQHVPLRHLILNNNGLGPAAGILIADALTTLAERKRNNTERRAEVKDSSPVPRLETITCGRNRLETGSMAAWAKAYAAHSGMREVKMVQNGIRQDGIVHLLREGLSRNAELRVLDLQDNTFTSTGARALASVIGGWGELIELGVGDCLLTRRGGIALADAMQKGNNAKLEVLRLQYNEIDAKGVKGLADALTRLPALRRIELNGNIFDEEDENVDTLREVLKTRKAQGNGLGSGDIEFWGLDELDELEEDSDDGEVDVESQNEEEGVEVEEKVAREVAAMQKAEEEQNVALEKDAKVDQLADMLGKTGISL